MIVKKEEINKLINLYALYFYFYCAYTKIGSYIAIFVFINKKLREYELEKMYIL
jgi:hypothetical protein